MAAKALPSQEVLRQLLDYDPETGLFNWLPRAGQTRWNKLHAGTQAFVTSSNGYLIGRIFAVNCRAHRVAWAMIYGDTGEEIDHINGIKTDNRIANLRAVSAGGNARNRPLRSDNRSGQNGVSQYKGVGRWRANIRFEGRLMHLGTFDTFDEAVSVRVKAEKSLGFHKNHGRKALQ